MTDEFLKKEIEETEDEELEYSWNWFLEHEHLRTNKHNLKIKSIIIKKAKLLKASIEKGCGITTNLLPCSCGGVGMKIYLCPTCQNLIQRLNKIIGENNDK